MIVTHSHPLMQPGVVAVHEGYQQVYPHNAVEPIVLFGALGKPGFGWHRPLVILLVNPADWRATAAVGTPANQE